MGILIALGICLLWWIITQHLGFYLWEVDDAFLNGIMLFTTSFLVFVITALYFQR